MRFKSTFLFIFPLYLFQWSLDADGSLRNARGPFFSICSNQACVRLSLLSKLSSYYGVLHF